MRNAGACRHTLQTRRLIYLSIWLALAAVLSQQAAPADVDTNQFWINLSEQDAQKGLPVELEGIVLCYDLGWGQLYVHDGQNAIYLNPRAFTNRFEIGDRVRIKGKTTWSIDSANLTNGTTMVEGHEPLPVATAMKVADMAESGGQWIEVHGRVRVAEASRERVTLVLKDGDQQCLVYVMQTSSADKFKHLADAEVKIKGINASRHRDGKLESAILFCPELDQITVISPSLVNRWEQPVTPIDTLLSQPLGDWTNQPVHINGVVSAYRPGESMVIKDPTGVLWADVIQVNQVLLYQRVDLWGFLSVRSNRTVLANSYFQITTKSPEQTHPAITVTEGSTAIAPFTEISQIRSLSKQQANQNLPVKIHGTLIFVDTDWRMAFVQDEHDAIFLAITQTDLQTGQFVEVTGQTDGNGFAPDLINCSVNILGTTNLPNPIKVDLQDTANGQLDSHWVEMEGVVHQVTKENGRLYLSLTGREGKFGATALDINTNGVPMGLIDSLISLRGACGSTVNSLGQLSGITLHVPSRDDIKIIDPSPADPFAITAIPISTVATFNPERLAGRRVKISGTVTLIAPGQYLFLQDDSGGIRVVTSQTDDFRVGERLNVLGFSALRDFSPCLEETSIRHDGTGILPMAKKTTAAQILLNGGYDGLRVELQAQLIQSYSSSAQARLLLQDGSIIFPAQISEPGEQNKLPALDTGSIVKLHGVCVIQGNENNEPASFRLLLTSPADITLIKTASWWTVTRTMIVLGGTAFAASLAILWVFLLRRQVRAQTEIIQQNQKVLLETSRLAGMAEIATNVLHNVGNVLNSVNVSASIVSNKVKESTTLNGLLRVAGLIEEHSHDLGDFINHDERGKHLPAFLRQLAERLRAENEMKIEELAALRKNLEHIKDIVARQLYLAKVGDNLEKVVPKEIMEDALLMNAGNFTQCGIEINRDYRADVNEIMVDKHKLLQILVNLISNAKNACLESDQPCKQITLRVKQTDGKLQMAVQDNGTGIAEENLVRIFRHGFTMRKTGHGFGLHSGALSAQQMGGQLSVKSDGLGRGACFTLELPINSSPSSKSSQPVSMAHSV